MRLGVITDVWSLVLVTVTFEMPPLDFESPKVNEYRRTARAVHPSLRSPLRLSRVRVGRQCRTARFFLIPPIL